MKQNKNIGKNKKRSKNQQLKEFLMSEEGTISIEDAIKEVNKKWLK